MFGNYGRFFARIPNDLAARALSADAGVSRADYFDAGLTQPIPERRAVTDPGGTPPLTHHFQLHGAGADAIDPNAKLSYMDEFVGGFECEVMPERQPRRALHPPQHPARARGRRPRTRSAAYDLGSPGLLSVDYILTNPSASYAGR